MDEVAVAFGMSKERVRQLEESALKKLEGSALRRFYDESE
jgi:DNA-directed RNA polymerase sigma subunit (sigma70/sigma32)